MRLLSLVLLTYVFSGCQTYSEEDINSFDEKIEDYLDEKNLDMNRLESGLYYRVIEETEDAPLIKYTDQVTFFYSGEFLDGRVFQTIPEDNALSFMVNELIVGWQEGLMLLHGTGSIELIIPPHLGYGTKKTEKIPPNSILRYSLTVMDVK